MRTDTIAFQTFRKLGATCGAVEPLRADVEKAVRTWSKQ